MWNALMQKKFMHSHKNVFLQFNAIIFAVALYHKKINRQLISWYFSKFNFEFIIAMLMNNVNQEFTMIFV